MSRLLWVVLAARGIAFAEDLRWVASSPYRIEQYVRTHNAFDTGDLWRALRVPDALSEPRGSGPAATLICDAAAPCEAWVQPMQLSWVRTGFAAVGISNPGRQITRYLVFEQRTRAGWRLVGHIDSTFAKYFDPILYPKEVGGRWWLVVREQSGSGTGFHESIQRWFELESGQICEVMSILGDGYLVSYPGWYIRRPSAVVTGYERAQRGEAFRVLYRLSYTLAGDDGVDEGYLGAIERLAIYRRQKNDSEFHLDAAGGTTQKDLDDVRGAAVARRAPTGVPRQRGAAGAK